MKPTTHALLQAQTRARRAADIVKRKKHAALKEAVVATAVEALTRYPSAVAASLGDPPDRVRLLRAVEALNAFEKGNG